MQVWGVVVGRKCSFYLLMSSCIAEGLIIKVPSGFSLSPSNSYLADSFYRLLLDRWGVNCLLPNKLLTIFIEVDFLCYNYLFRSSGTPSVDWSDLLEADKVEGTLEFEICSVEANLK